VRPTFVIIFYCWIGGLKPSSQQHHPPPPEQWVRHPTSNIRLDIDHFDILITCTTSCTTTQPGANITLTPNFLSLLSSPSLGFVILSILVTLSVRNNFLDYLLPLTPHPSLPEPRFGSQRWGNPTKTVIHPFLYFFVLWLSSLEYAR
jgi:hypothetical protein